MKNIINKKTICLASAALLLVAGLSVGKTMAYFTAFAESKGSVALDLGFTKTVPVEAVEDGEKRIVIQNTGDYDCYVRMKALVGDDYSVIYEEELPEGKWNPGEDGFYYYSDIVPAKTGATSQINVVIPRLKEDITEEAAAFNVIIVQESTPVLYDENGEAYADWDKVADVLKIVPAQEGGDD